MAKNMTRKSLAIGAAVALGGSLFATAPAYADNTLTIAPTLGTSYNTLLGSDIQLQAVLESDASTNENMIKWKVVGIESADLDAWTGSSLLPDDSDLASEANLARKLEHSNITTGAISVFTEIPSDAEEKLQYLGAKTNADGDNLFGELDDGGDPADKSDDADNLVVTDFTAAANDDDTFVLAPSVRFNYNLDTATDGDNIGSAVLAAGDIDQFAHAEDEIALLQLDIADSELVGAQETIEFTVQAWTDSTENNQIDPGETRSEEITVKFVAADEVDATTVISADLGGSIAAAVTINDLNNEQNTSVFVTFTENGTEVDVTGANELALDGDDPEYLTAVWVADDENYQVETADLNLSAGVYRARAYTPFLAEWDGAADTATTPDYHAPLGALSGTSVVFAGNADANTDSDWDEINNANVAMANANAATVRTGETVELAYEVVDGDGYAIDDVNVRFTVNISGDIEATSTALLDEDSVVNVGSAVVDDDAITDGDDIELYTVTDSDGLATLTFSGGVEGDVVEVIADYESDTGYTDSEAVVVTFQDSYATTLVQLNSLSTTDEILVDASEEVTLSFVVHDQWSTPFDEDNFEIEVSWTDEDDDTNNDFTDEISGGLASFDITAPSEAGTYDVTAKVYDNGNDNYDVNAAGDAEVSLDIDLNVNDGTPTTVTVTGDEDSVGVAGVPLGAYDNRVAQSSPYDDALDGSDSVFTVTVRDEFGVPMQGQTVTVSAAGLGFTAATTAATGLTAGGLNTFSAETNSDGEVVFTAYSNTAAEELMISVTAGGVTEEAEVTFTGISTVFPGSGLSLDVAETVMSGTANDVVVTLTDELGNPIEDVDVTLDATGVGYLQDEVKTTNSQGQINTKLIIGSNESGSATITATVVLADDTSTPADEEGTTLTVSTTISVGYGTVSAWTKDMGDGTAKVYVKFPTIGEKVRIGHQTGGSGSYETIFVKTITSQADSALVVNANGSYIVRTIDLEDINRIRVTVGDDTLVQVRYNQ